MTVLPTDETLRIDAGSLRDYRALAEHHYRSGSPFAPTAVYAMRHDAPDAVARFTGAAARPTLVGVLVMTRPQLTCTLRDHATGGRYARLRRSEAADLLNAEVRTIARVVLEPRYRGLGLAVRLVKHALAHDDTPYVEALAAMGRVNPFFERAGMGRYEAPPRPADSRLLDAMTEVNWPRTLLASPRLLAQRLGELEAARRAWIEGELRRWHRSAAFMARGKAQAAGLDDVLRLARDRLLSRCVYYLHHDPQRGRS